ncbi:hypothetical protein C6366_07855 [Desulfonatronum sp. SC1]|nr:hypothetical protein C6366_07855 [Desulfonatronum sp. SC1]
MAAACSDPLHLVGKYQSLPEAERFVLLDLQPNGQGTWETDFDVVSFRWKQRGGDIWLHTRTGGVITGDIVDAIRLKVDLPGVGVIVLERQ